MRVSEGIHISHERLALRGMRPPQGQAVAASLVLTACAIGASYLLAVFQGADAPQYAALATLAICVAGSFLVLHGLSVAYPYARLGLCNILTMTRAAGIAVMAGLLVVGSGAPPDWSLVLLAGGVLAIDALDGWAARRSGLSSAFGARFDVEADVAFAVVMAALAWQTGKVGPWFLALGALRPTFLLARAAWPRLRGDLPDAMWRKSVAALQMTVQVLLLAPVIVPPVSQVIGAALFAAVVVSFAVDIRWLLTRPRGRT